MCSEIIQHHLIIFPFAEVNKIWIWFLIDMADDRGGMEASGTRAPRALGHLVFLLINFSDVCSNFISFFRGRKGSGTRVFGH